MASNAAKAAAIVEAQPATLYWKDRDILPGGLADSPHTDRLLWVSPVFAAPLEVPIAAVKAVQFPVTTKPDAPQGAYCFELAGGDVLFGTLHALSEDGAVIDATGFGQLHVDRTVLRRIYRWNRNDLLYTGPTGLAGWNISGSKGAWREEGGQLLTEEVGAVIRRDFDAPALARFEVDLSWRTKPDFLLAFGVGNDPKSVDRAFRFDVWDNKIVAWRETDRDADVAPLVTKIEPGPGHVHLLALVDQEHGRMLVFSAAGEQLADLKVASGKPQAYGGLQLTNRSGDIRLEHLRIGRWIGETPRPVEADKARIHATDGTIAYGELKAYDAERHQFVVDGAEGVTRLDEAQVQDIFLSPQDDVPPRSLSAVHAAGIRISGELVKIEEGKVWIKCPGIREPLCSPIAELHSLVTLNPQGDAPAAPGREGRLDLEGVSLHGCLVNSTVSEACCLVWQPRYCSKGSPLASGAKGRIVYRERAPAQNKAAANRAANAQGAGGRFGVVVRAAVAGAPAAAQAAPVAPENAAKPASGLAVGNGASILHLRYGDCIPCTVESIDDTGVTFSTPLTDTTFVRHDKIQALELMPEVSPGTIAKVKKERLLTLPRMQRDNPPTQLIRSVDGDYLRGRLIGMDAENLQVEVRLETKTLPRNRVARIIWLYPDEVAMAVPAAESDKPSAVRVQALQGDGNRLTFVADRFEDTTLSGTSELLGICRADVTKIDELLIGGAIEQEAATLAFHQWQLKQAPEPLAAPDGEGGEGGSEGLDAALVGKPAPDFTLSMLDGKKTRLADYKGSVLVLDFWASWCGPCLQTMPQVDKVADEMADQGVKLLAINLEEPAEQVKTALGRLQLDMPVGLDRDGRVAERYGATSIPQTVIIDRDGKVARLFVGASARFDEQLRAALKSVLSGQAPAGE